MRCSRSVDNSTALIAIALAPILEKTCPRLIKDPDALGIPMIVGVAATFVAADATEKDAVVVVDADGTTFAAAADAARAAVCTLILRNIFFFFLVFFFSRVNVVKTKERRPSIGSVFSSPLLSSKVFLLLLLLLLRRSKREEDFEPHDNTTLSQMVFLCCLGSIFCRKIFFLFF